MYLPQPAFIDNIIDENSEIKTFTLRFADEARQASFRYEPGQFVMLSVLHCGEAPISFSSSPARKGAFELSVRKAGKLTSALHRLRPGDTVGIRGPYGRAFPLKALHGNNLLFVAGGIGLAPLRSLVTFCLDRQHDGRMTLLYGSRTPADISFRRDIERWQSQGVDCRLTVDQGDSGWQGHTGLVTTLLPSLAPLAEHTVALVCGPPIMIQSVMDAVSAMGLADTKIITTMERHMKCGVGVCGHCHMEGKMICTDGPVFSKHELAALSS